MPRLTDRAMIRTLLEVDRLWAAYALADLEPGLFEHTSWFRTDDEASTLALIYAAVHSAFVTSVLMTFGNAQGLRRILHEIDTTLHPRELYVAVRSEVLPLLAERYQLTHEKAMQRMALDPTRYQPITTDRVVRLGPTDLEPGHRLYGRGEARGEAPARVSPRRVGQRASFGARATPRPVP